MPIITEPEPEGKPWFYLSTEILIALIVILSCVGSFGLGYLAGKERGGGDVRIYTPTEEEISNAAVSIPANANLASPKAALPSVAPTPAPPEGGGYVASKSGAKYHLPWCAGAKQIKESNKIYFATKAEAEAAGYTPAANCKGI